MARAGENFDVLIILLTLKQVLTLEKMNPHRPTFDKVENIKNVKQSW